MGGGLSDLFQPLIKAECGGLSWVLENSNHHFSEQRTTTLD
jgi:hypothetical protein